MIPGVSRPSGKGSDPALQRRTEYQRGSVLQGHTDALGESWASLHLGTSSLDSTFCPPLGRGRKGRKSAPPPWRSQLTATMHLDPRPHRKEVQWRGRWTRREGSGSPVPWPRPGPTWEAARRIQTRSGRLYLCARLRQVSALGQRFRLPRDWVSARLRPFHQQGGTRPGPSPPGKGPAPPASAPKAGDPDPQGCYRCGVPAGTPLLPCRAAGRRHSAIQQT